MATQGVEGKYIHVVPRTGEGDVGFTTESSIDVSFKEMIARIVVVCSHYSAISHYVDSKRARFENELPSGLPRFALVALAPSCISTALVSWQTMADFAPDALTRPCRRQCERY